MYIEGVQAQGTRTTTTIPAGDIGNDRPINIVDERWYSPDLQMTIMTKHSDPRSGETNFPLKNINRSSPPPTLFEVPSDYTVKPAAGGGRSGGAGVSAFGVRQTEEVTGRRPAASHGVFWHDGNRYARRSYYCFLGWSCSRRPPKSIRWKPCKSRETSRSPPNGSWLLPG